MALRLTRMIGSPPGRVMFDPECSAWNDFFIVLELGLPPSTPAGLVIMMVRAPLPLIEVLKLFSRSGCIPEEDPICGLSIGRPYA